MSGNRALTSLQTGVGSTLLALLALPVSRAWLEQSLIGHVFVQMPLAVLSGWLFGSTLAAWSDRAMQRWNRGGIAGLTFVVFTVLFWMLPRSVDGAVQHAGYELVKFANLPCAGLALALSFQRAPTLLRGVLKANLISMLGVLAWLYTSAPVRLCNSYLKEDQTMLGLSMALLAGTLAISWGLSLLFGPTWRARPIFDRAVPASPPSPAISWPRQGRKRRLRG